ncbi:hypothetical protein [Acinetobacter wuhouensis]|uniref:Uncharacterized protein n=1 Tax=Acinetobacter wuhouensis TaxID=1879050 RepID=A0A4Q7ABL5_9GAMM|nr:hypothetical protein [Acinetobacter wuhouensis]RZG42752.1 hypothetical protein EXU28_18645 [Acinetobacter wuhouensis]
MGLTKKGVASVVLLAVSLLAVTTGAFAITEADVTSATGSAGGEDTVSAGFKYLLTFAVGLYVGRKVLGMFGRS